ncbi:MAG: hypothetical protein JXD19_00385 [Deltaproteobacteria bacterium]|nr:hypothetical protein [Deltaproteobacteria bacterium]
MMTKKIVGCFLLLFLVFSFGSAAVAEEAEKPTCDFTLTFYSQYIWRGFELSKDSLVIFPSITVSYKGFGFNVWGDFDTDYEGANTGGNGTEWWETDWVLTYSNTLNVGFTDLNWTVGWIYYDVDGGEDEELFVILGLDTFLSPELSVWNGIEYGDDSWYFNFALSHSWDLPVCWPKAENKWSLDVGGWVSYYYIENGDLNGSDYEEWHDGTIWAGVNVPINDWCTITPSINYTFPLCDDSEDFLEAASFDGNDSDFFYGGVTLSVSF